jgi:hypothetical protein
VKNFNLQSLQGASKEDIISSRQLVQFPDPTGGPCFLTALGNLCDFQDESLTSGPQEFATDEVTQNPMLSQPALCFHSHPPASGLLDGGQVGANVADAV